MGTTCTCSLALQGGDVHRVPIAGDTTRLPFATGLTPLEKQLARAQHFLAKHLGGTQQVRQLMGHVQFGARGRAGGIVPTESSPNSKKGLQNMERHNVGLQSTGLHNIESWNQVPCD